MTRFATILTFLILSITCQGQTKDIDSVSTMEFKSLEELLAVSETIDNETFELKFLIRVLPDNGWFLKLRNDSSYEYIHWSGWGEPDGTILETGKYEISKNQIKLIPDKKKSELESADFYLVTSTTNEIDNNITIDCEELNSKVYCLFKKYKNNR